jgi:indolepyruvate ferredoxin oxidoreductase
MSSPVAGDQPQKTPDVSLKDKYTQTHGMAYMSGIHALVRSPLAQAVRDKAAGRTTAGFISGYRGSPLGHFDSELWRAGDLLERHNVVFQPGVNEDLAATAVWGSQQANLAGQGKFDGVVAWWYGKGPGVDRSGDAFRHANLAGTAPYGGAVALYGDDHSCKSSSVPHQSEHIMIGCGMPIFYPTSVQQVLDFGVHAVALSRFAGLWTSMKLVSEIVETSASVDVAIDRITPVLPELPSAPAGGLNIRWPDLPLAQEERLYKHRIPAAIAYARANRINRIVWDCPKPVVGIAASGKGYLDTVEALRILGIDETVAKRMGLRLYQVGMIWPLEPQGLREFAHGLQELIVVEEKRPILETQIKDELYALPDGARPRVVGKSIDGLGEWSTPAEQAPLISHYELQPEPIAKMLARRFLNLQHISMELRQTFQERLEALQQAEKDSRRVIDIAERKAHFCSGCPHNSSTVVPEGSRALGGIGCHFLALSMDRGTETFTHMGGEGASWVGASHFTNEEHVFVNIGDGTYFHSGHLAIRQAIAAKVNVTYKVLYNDAVGMTGGQRVDGQLSVAQLTRQLAAEGVVKQVIVSDEPGLLGKDPSLAPGVTVRHRRELDAVQRELRATPGTTALIFAQTCASEKRRRRKRGEYPDPAKRAFINTDVCEGCGDCSRQSNCLSVEPVDTPLGIKRQINQGSCNKDFSCVDGFCPSFVTVATRDVKHRPVAAGVGPDWPPAPVIDELAQPVRILVSGVGGTGVVTIGALLGMAAHLEGKAVRVMDMAGIAQKGGTVYSHVQIARSDDEISATKIAAGQCDVLIGADAVVAGSNATLSRLRNQGLAIVNEDSPPTSEFVKSRDWAAPINDLLSRLRARLSDGTLTTFPASRIATQLLGDSIFANLILLGVAWQLGRVPLMRKSLESAIELNGTAVAKNLEAFRVGCHLGSNPGLARRFLQAPQSSPTLPELIADRWKRLVDYWSPVYAGKYRDLAVRAQDVLPPDLATVVATQLYRVMAYKDEYEVARTLTSTEFEKSIKEQFGGDARHSYHLAPPWLVNRARKRQFGPWMRVPLVILARLKGLRESPLDPFGWNSERRDERAWRDRYIAFVERLTSTTTDVDLSVATQIARIPAEVRGFGHVKMKAMRIAAARWDELEMSLVKKVRPVGTAQLQQATSAAVQK